MEKYRISVNRKLLASAIDKIKSGYEGPLLDLEWLLDRFDDTVKYKEPQLKKQSIFELEKSLENFRNEYPDFLPIVECSLIDEDFKC